MQQAKRYFFMTWLKISFLIHAVFGLLIFLVFFAMLFMQLGQIDISLRTILYWVTLQVANLGVTLLALTLILSLLFTIFYFEQNGELKSFYLIRLNFRNLSHQITFVALLTIVMQQYLSQSLMPDWKVQERQLQEAYLLSANNTMQRLNFIYDEYFIELRVYNAQRQEMRGLFLVLIEIDQLSSAQYLWIEAAQASWQTDGWLLNQVRIVDSKKHWSYHESFLLEDYLPSPAILLGLVSSTAWAEKGSGELREIIRDPDTSSHTRTEIIYHLIDRFSQWLLLIWLWLAVQNYDPSMSLALWRVALKAISGFVLFQVIKLWAEVALDQSAINLFIAILLPHMSLGIWLFALKYLEKKSQMNY